MHEAAPRRPRQRVPSPPGFRIAGLYSLQPHVFLRVRRGAASAAKDNGGVCTFPYCGCWTDFNVTNLRVYDAAVVNQTYTFTLVALNPTPLGHGCTQDLHKVEFNSCKLQWPLPTMVGKNLRCMGGAHGRGRRSSLLSA